MPGDAHLKALFRLDQSSPQFPKELNDVIGGREFDDHISGLRAGDLKEVVDYLDKVPLSADSSCHRLNPQ